MADRGRHLAQRREFLALREALLRLLEVLFGLLTLGDFPLQAGVETAKLCRFPLEHRRLDAGAATQDVESPRQQKRESHDLERQNPVHPLPHRGIGGVADDAPAAERDARLQPDRLGPEEQRALIPERPVAGGLDRALDGRGCGFEVQRLLLGPATPARLGRQDDLAFGTGQEHGLGRAAPTIDDAAQIDLHEDHAKQVVADLYPPRKREIEAAGLRLVCGEDGVGGPQRLKEEGVRGTQFGYQLPVGGGHDAPLAVQQDQRGRADFLHIGDQPLRGGREIVSARASGSGPDRATAEAAPPNDAEAPT